MRRHAVGKRTGEETATGRASPRPETNAPVGLDKVRDRVQPAVEPNPPPAASVPSPIPVQSRAYQPCKGLYVVVRSRFVANGARRRRASLAAVPFRTGLADFVAGASSLTLPMGPVPPKKCRAARVLPP